MLFYIRIPKRSRRQDANSSSPQPLSVLAQNRRLRHHQAEVKTIHQTTQENYMLERRWLI